MKHTLKKLYTYFSIILLTAFCTFSFAQDAFSAPKWIKVTYSKPTLQVIGKDKNNSGYLALKVSVTHKNNSKKGEVIKAIFDKTLQVSYTLGPGRYTSLSNTVNVTSRVKSNKVNKVEIYPGQKFTLYYLVPIDKKGSIGKSSLNDQIISDYKAGRVNDIFKNRKYAYEFQVKKGK